MPEVIINVTQAHIDNGVPGDCLGCAMALAINESLSTGGCIVTGLTAQVHLSIGDSGLFVFSLPPEARRFVHEYDLGKTPQSPFSFPLTLPEAK